MAPKFEASLEMQNIIKNLKEKRPDIFDFVDTTMISCGLRTDKNPPPNQKWTLKIEGIRGSKTLINPVIKYIIWGFESDWADLSDIEKTGYIANMLFRIRTPTDDELLKLAEKNEEWKWGKLKQPDVVDMKAWLKAFGVEWDEEGSGMNNILDKNSVPSLG